MGKYWIEGGNKLFGELEVEGAKNAALPILAASVLSGKETVLHRCPQISDVSVTTEILQALGAKVTRSGNTLLLQTDSVISFCVPEELAKKMRSSIVFLGSLLGRFQQAKLAYPGGCAIGARPIDIHLKALKQMGVSIQEENGFLNCTAKKLHGARINLDFPSVGATENIMLAAVLARGRTVIYNAAREPEIADLQEFLKQMGARVRGAGTETIVIEGVKALKEAEYTLMGDRIEAGTYLTAAALCGGEIRLTGIRPSCMRQALIRLMEAGCGIEEEEEAIILAAPKKILPIEKLRTQPYPGFPTDLQPQFMSLLTLAEGTSMIIETVFEARFRHIVELCRMGADITVEDRTAVVKGVPRLLGAHVTAYDLRGGAALIIAGLRAEGETIVDQSCFVERGYVCIEKKFSSLGANIVHRE